MSQRLNILAISGSLRSGSSHHAILAHLKDTNPAYHVVIYDGIEAIPNFNPGLDNDNPPTAVANFRNALTAADGVLICAPEYAYGLPGALKNALDWTVSSGDFVNKPAAFITASGLGESAHASMQLVLTAMNSTIAPGGSLLIPWFKTKMNADNQITDPQTEQDIQNVFKALTDTINGNK